jgi:hypothetical protein
VAADFKELLEFTRAAFERTALAHSCWLQHRLQTLVLDGQWCLQATICNARNTGLYYDDILKLGFFKGCAERPFPGSLFCKRHLAELKEDTSKLLTNHRVELQLRVAHAYVNSDALLL